MFDPTCNTKDLKVYQPLLCVTLKAKNNDSDVNLLFKKEKTKKATFLFRCHGYHKPAVDTSVTLHEII